MSAAEPQGVTRYRRRGQVLLPNETVYDDSISYAALGVLAVLLARPDEAPKGYRTLLRPKAHVGQASLLAALRELNTAGYRRQFLRSATSTRGRNIVLTDTYISEDPLTDSAFRNWHREATGQEPIDMPKQASANGATKDTLASVRGAHDRGAHDRGAHGAGAQDKAFPGSSKLSKFNQGAAAAAAPAEAPTQAERPADADTPNGGSRQAPRGAAESSDAVADERIHCLGCDHTYYRDELNAKGQCTSCVAQLRAAEDAARAAAEPAPDPAEVARLAAEAKHASLVRQAKRLHITVDELLAKRQPRT